MNGTPPVAVAALALKKASSLGGVKSRLLSRADTGRCLLRVEDITHGRL